MRQMSICIHTLDLVCIFDHCWLTWDNDSSVTHMPVVRWNPKYCQLNQSPAKAKEQSQELYLATRDPDPSTCSCREKETELKIR
jgi:hypothetical protein